MFRNILTDSCSSAYVTKSTCSTVRSRVSEEGEEEDGVVEDDDGVIVDCNGLTTSVGECECECEGEGSEEAAAALRRLVTAETACLLGIIERVSSHNHEGTLPNKPSLDVELLPCLDVCAVGRPVGVACPSFGTAAAAELLLWLKLLC